MGLLCFSLTCALMVGSLFSPGTANPSFSLASPKASHGSPTP